VKIYSCSRYFQQSDICALATALHHDVLRKLDKHLLCFNHMVGSVEPSRYVRFEVHTVRRASSSGCMFCGVHFDKPAPIYGAE
jgi:hypothetical protein